MKRIISFALVLAMLLSCMPLSILAVESADNCTIRVESVEGTPGSTVEMSVVVENNPGILGATLKLSWDSGLTLTSVECGEAFAMLNMTKPNKWQTSGGNYIFYGEALTDDEIVDGNVLNLIFTVDATATFGTSYGVRVSYESGDIFDKDLNPVDPIVVNGGIAITYLPGDVNGDKRINALDLILLCRFIADGSKNDPYGYNTNINELAGDVDANGRWNALDLIYICRYIADGCKTDPNGYNVTLKHSGMEHTHRMTAVGAKAATCTEDGNIAYWYCSACGKYFVDESGATEIVLADTVIKAEHTLIFVPRKEATLEEEGNIEYWDCTNCEKLFADYACKNEIILADTVIGKINRTPHTISYNLTNNDSYLQNNISSIVNDNPVVFYEEEELVLVDAQMQGYNFEGWYDGTGSNANRVTKIALGTTKDITLYARWTISENSKYTVYFVSEGAACDVVYNGENVSKITKYMNEQLILPAPAMQGYIFLCWTDGDGNIVTSIEPGSHGEITLSAHWTSERNQTRPVKELGAPIVVEDDTEGKIHFIYELGDIINVPLEVLENYGNVDRLERESQTVASKTITSSTAEKISETVANVTSKSSSITLSEDWNENISVSEEQSSDVSEENIDVITDRVENGGQWNISASNGGTTEFSVTSGESASSTHKSTTAAVHSSNMALKSTAESGFSGEINVGSSRSASTETRQDFNIGLNTSTGVSAKGDVGGAEIGGQKSWGLDAGYSNGRTTTNSNTSHTDITLGRTQKVGAEVSFGQDYSASSGTEDSSESKTYTDLTSSNTNTWNSEEGFTQSNNDAHEESYTSAISKAIGEKFGYSTSTSTSGGESNTASSLEENEKTNEYVSTVEYSTEERTETMTSSKVYKDYAGYHRLVEAGTLHVFGIVTYDIALGAYYTSTYSILDPETAPFYDYSVDGTYSDRENGILPFDIPFFVNRYVSANMGYTEGLVIEPETGDVHGYEGSAKNVMLPNYYSVDEGDGTRSAIKVSKFLPNAFAGNEQIETVMLGDFITEIPDGAFAGCTNLKTVIAPGVTSIGKDAFKGCVSLNKFSVTSKVKSLGENAFEGVNEIVVYAYDSDVAKAAVNSGAAKISLYFADTVDSLSEYTIETGANTIFFALYGAGKTFENVKVVSKAEETILNRATFNADSGIVLDIYSKKLTVNQLNANAGVIALLLRSPSAHIDIERTSTFTSSIKNAVVTNEVSIAKTTAYAAYFKVEGNMYVNGNTNFVGRTIVSPDSSIAGIDAEKYAAMTGTVTVSFNSNGGTDVSEQELYYGTKATMPVEPTKPTYSFIGWYTDEECTTAFDFSTPITADITLYAKWDMNEFELNFDANGGSVSETSRTAICNVALGELPTPERTGYTFEGWYASDGERITAESILVSATAVTVYAQWSANKYTVALDATGGSVSPSSATVEYDGTYGLLPTPTRTGFSFGGWYTAASGGEKVYDSTIFAESSDHTLYAQWTANEYWVAWDTDSPNLTITVTRTSSPYAGADSGALNCWDTIYYGDVLKISYSAHAGYSLLYKGKESITVTSNVSSSDIYAEATANSYPYDVICRTASGIYLDSYSVTHVYGTTNTIDPPDFAGYTTPASQSVTWDSTSKTVSFEYYPAYVPNTQTIASGIWEHCYCGSYDTSDNALVRYNVVVEFGTRYSDGIEVRVHWTNTLTAWHYWLERQVGKVAIGGISTGDFTVVEANEWTSSNWVNYEKSKTVSTVWFTVPCTATQNTVSFAVKGDWATGTLTIPTF